MAWSTCKSSVAKIKISLISEGWLQVEVVLTSCKTRSRISVRGFPGGAVVENPPGNAGDMGLIPGPGRSHMPRSNKPVRYSY